MRSSIKMIAVLVGASFAAVCGTAWADTLQMKDGRVIQGRFFGGSQASVQFETNGKVELYDVDDIISVTFTSPPPAPQASATPQDALPSAPLPPPGVAQQPQPDAAANSITVPAGADLLVRMIDSVDSDKNNVGDRFRASLEQDFVVNGVVVATKGTDVYGRLSEAKEAGHFEGKSQLKLELTDILIHNRLQPIVTGEYELSGSSRGANTAKKVGIGAVAGTVLGAIVGGGKGAAIGAGVGAGAGAGVQLATKGEQVHVPSETLLDFRIAQPFTVSGAGQ
jgi:hypothetical protein